MRTERNARLCFGITSAVVTAGLVLQLILSLTKDQHDGLFASRAKRLVVFFSFFTVLSNIGVAVTTGLLARRLDRRSRWFWVARLDAMICITVTGVVFHLALADLQELTGWDRLADFLLHTLSPILCPLGWLVFGPRHRIDRDIVLRAVVGPVCWLAYALVLGTVLEDRHGDAYYAYPFMNVEVHGYAVALLRCAIVAVLFLGLAGAALAIDRRMPADRPTRA